MGRIVKEDVTSILPTQIHSISSSVNINNVADNIEVDFFVDQLLNLNNNNNNNEDHIQPQQNPNVQQDFCTTSIAL